MPDSVKILVCYHKQAPLLADGILTPVSVGHALTGDLDFTPFSDKKVKILADDDGENISQKNRTYNELTAVYWAWKNYEKVGSPDYIGLSHYRRIMLFDENHEKSVYTFAPDDFLERIGYSEEKVRTLLKKYDFLYCQGTVENVYEQFAENHPAEDLIAAVEIIREKYPSYRKAMKRFLQGRTGCFCNMFVFPKDIFFRYCSFIFDVLGEYEKRTNKQKRMFISERITGIFIEKLIEEGKNGKGLSSAFMEEPMTINVCAPYDENDPFPIFITLVSLLENAEKDTFFNVRLLSEQDIKSQDYALESLQSRYPSHAFTKIDARERLLSYGIDTRYAKRIFFPFYLPLLGQKGRVLYVTEKTLCVGAFKEWYRSCNLNDYAYLVNNGSKTLWNKNLIMTDTTMLGIPNQEETVSNFNLSYVAIGITPAYVAKKEGSPEEKTGKRQQKTNRAWGKLFMIYDGVFPLYRFDGEYAAAWLAYAKKVPGGVPFSVPPFSSFDIGRTYFPLIDRSEQKCKKTVLGKALVFLRKHGIRRTFRKARGELVARAKG